MDVQRRTSLTFGVLLVLLGAIFLAFQLSPQLQELIDWSAAWPLIVVGIGVALLIVAVLSGVSGLAIPASIVGGIGALLWWQNATDNWETWSFAWALIPGFVGVGILLNGLLSGKLRSAFVPGGWLLLISLLMFFIFGSFFGQLGVLGNYWPVLLIVLGFIILARPLFRSHA